MSFIHVKSLGVISKNSQLIKVTGYQPALTDKRSYHAELSTERTISHPGQGKLAYSSGKGLWMLLLPAVIQAQLALVKIGSPVKGKGLAPSTSGGELLPVSSREEGGSAPVSRDSEYMSCATHCQAPSWFLSELYLCLMKTNTVNWH